MSKFIKYKGFIINVDNITYIDTEPNNYGRISISFGQGRYVEFNKTDELVKLLNSLLEDQSIKNIEK